MTISCPKCESSVERAGFPWWYWLVGIIFFPVGFLVFFLGRSNTVCGKCGHSWMP